MNPDQSSFDYKLYWEQVYACGGNSGSGSYGLLAEFKAEVINDFIQQHQIDSVIEFGCGDGHQLGLMKYKQYLGFDIAPSSIALCAAKYKMDPSKSFMTYHPDYFFNKGYLTADCVVCLDVLYHITNELDFKKTLNDLFQCAKQYIILYTKITEDHATSAIHTIQDRNIWRYLSAYESFEVLSTIEQKYKELSSASFIMLRRKSD